MSCFNLPNRQKAKSKCYLTSKRYLSVNHIGMRIFNILVLFPPHFFPVQKLTGFLFLFPTSVRVKVHCQVKGLYCQSMYSSHCLAKDKKREPISKDISISTLLNL